jgi:2-methylisocitrate lyase-like PEP mutase family enzyme
MTVTQADKAKQFRALHEAPDAYVIANVWDGGSARMMAALGFVALATSAKRMAAMRRIVLKKSPKTYRRPILGNIVA